MKNLLFASLLSLSAAPAVQAQTEAPEPASNFMSSVKQALQKNVDDEVVRGHFDVGTPPDVHRYYCMADPKTGRREPNGVGGQLYVRRDGMTAVKSGAVAFFSCIDAERKGLLHTDGYLLTVGAQKAVDAARPAPAAPAPAQTATPEPAASTAQAAATAQTAVAGAPAAGSPISGAGLDETARNGVRAVFLNFIAGQNAHDAGTVAGLLLDSTDFAWAQSGGATVWGRQAAMQAFVEDWKGTWKLEPQVQELRIGSIAPGTALLITPLLFTQGARGEVASTVPVRWSGVFVGTPSGWRIAAIVITPYKGWQPVP